MHVILVRDDLTSRMSRSVPLRPFETVSGWKNVSNIFVNQRWIGSRGTKFHCLRSSPRTNQSSVLQNTTYLYLISYRIFKGQLRSFRVILYLIRDAFRLIFSMDWMHRTNYRLSLSHSLWLKKWQRPQVTSKLCHFYLGVAFLS